MVESLDDNVGRLLAALETSNLRSGTLIFLLADHGASSPADNGSLRGGAGDFFEGGIRVPFVASWPSRWAQGQTFRPLVSTLDVAATVLAMAGVARPSSAPALDGVDLDPFVRGDRAGEPHEALFWRRSTTGGYAIRSGDLKLMREDSGSESALYDLAADPGETRSVLVGNAATANLLASLWNTWNEGNTDGNLFTPAETYETERQAVLQEVLGKNRRVAPHSDRSWTSGPRRRVARRRRRANRRKRRSHRCRRPPLRPT